MTFTTLTFNMQNGQPWNEACPDSGEVDLKRTVSFLREQDVDIIFLQEVERGHEGGKQIMPPPHHAWLRECLREYDAVFAYPLPNEMELPFGLGLSIFSKTPLRDFERVELPPPEIEFEFAGHCESHLTAFSLPPPQMCKIARFDF